MDYKEAASKLRTAGQEPLGLIYTWVHQHLLDSKAFKKLVSDLFEDELNSLNKKLRKQKKQIMRLENEQE